MSNIEVLEQLWISALLFVAGLILLIFILKRVLAWMDERGWIAYTGHVPTYRSLGNAFLELQSLAEPEKQYVIQVRQDQEQKHEQDDAGGPDKT